MTETEQTQQTEPLRYKGSQNHYVDIAIRGDGENVEHLGLGAEYAVHPVTKVGCFILRFVVHGAGVDPKKYKHLMFRESAKFVIPSSQTNAGYVHAKVFKGVRLNKIAIPAFEPAIGKHEVDKFATKFGIWALLEEWVAEQVQAEGFLLIVNLPQELRTLLVGKETPEGAVKSVIAFPDLASEEAQAESLKQVKKPAPEPEDEESEEDGDDEDDDKEWLN